MDICTEMEPYREQDTSVTGTICEQHDKHSALKHSLRNTDFSTVQEERNLPIKIYIDFSSILVSSITNTSFFESDIMKEIVAECYLEKIKNKSDYVSQEAEFWLGKDPYVLESVFEVLKAISKKIERVDADIGLEVFSDVEVEDWDTFRVVIKPKDMQEKDFDEVMELWDELSEKANKILENLSSKNKMYEKKIDKLKSNFIVSIDVE